MPSAVLVPAASTEAACDPDSMPTLETDQLIDVVRTESARFARDFAAVRPGDPVPSCPQWTAGRLMGHLGGVQRFATVVVSEERTSMASDDELAALFASPAEAEGADPTVATHALLGWFETAAAGLVVALVAAPPDLRTILFLTNPDPPRRYWARRQAHEATIHRVDMLAARLGRLPATSEARIDRGVALDGIDELLRGFLPRPSTELRTDQPYRIAIRPTDADAGWTVAVSGEPPVAERGLAADADAELSGTAAALYLGLWNRGDEITGAGSIDALAHWRAEMRV